jgi:hypothetical protein
MSVGSSYAYTALYGAYLNRRAIVQDYLSTFFAPRPLCFVPFSSGCILAARVPVSMKVSPRVKFHLTWSSLPTNRTA